MELDKGALEKAEQAVVTMLLNWYGDVPSPQRTLEVAEKIVLAYKASEPRPAAPPEGWPTGEEVAEFLKVFRRLEGFEATQRVIRGGGAFRANECPNPATVKVIGWLENIPVGTIAPAEQSPVSEGEAHQETSPPAPGEG